MALVQQLFALLADSDASPQEERQGHWDAFGPDLSRSFAGPRPPAAAVQELSDRQDIGLSTSYGLEQLNASASRALLAWTRQRGLRLNATLHAAFLQALVAAEVVPAQTVATTVVNLRPWPRRQCPGS